MSTANILPFLFFGKSLVLDSTRPVCHLQLRDEAFDLCSLDCVCMWRSERANECLAAVAGTHASADMAGGGAGCAACPDAVYRGWGWG